MTNRIVPSTVGDETIFSLTLLLTLLIGFAFFEVLAPVLSVSNSRFVYTSPAIAYGIWGLLTTCLGAFLIWQKNTRFRHIGLAFSLLIIVDLYLSPAGSQRGFLESLYSIKPHATPQEVRAIMGKYDTEPRNYDVSDASFGYTHSLEPLYNSDIGVVVIRNGRVQSVEFMPD